jgi:hypothetical protein
MDEFKKKLAVALKHKFWILAVLLLLLSVVGFWIAESGLSKLLAERVAAINKGYDDVQQVNSKVATHPNQHSHAKMEEMLKRKEFDVREAWSERYMNQLPLMTWPSEAFAQEETADIFRSLRPVEKFIEFPIGELPGDLAKITEADRRVYRDYIGPVFKKITSQIGTEWKAELKANAGGMGYGGMGGMGSMGGMGGEGGDGYGGGMGGFGAGAPGAVSNDVVIWQVASQQALLDQIVPWYNPNSAPSILDIYYTQEDMWLLGNIMKIIKATNENAKENFQAVVKEIEWIRMGRHANRDAGKLYAGASSGGTAAVWEWEWEVPKEVMATEGWKAAEWKAGWAGWAAWKAVRGLKVVAWKEEWKAAEWKAGWRVVLQVPGTRRTIDISVLQRRRSSSQEKAKKFALRSKMCSPAMRLMRLPSVSKFAFACEWSRVKFIA